jgi:hypothetical protein
VGGPVFEYLGCAVVIGHTVLPPFAAAERLDLEGIIAKRKKDPYGPRTVWYKTKNRAYTQLEGRGDLFYPRGRST